MIKQLRGKGTKRQPFLLTNEEYDQIKRLLDEGEKAINNCEPGDVRQIRDRYRMDIMQQFPQLFDYACLEVVSPFEAGVEVIA